MSHNDSGEDPAIWLAAITDMHGQEVAKCYQSLVRERGQAPTDPYEKQSLLTTAVRLAIHESKLSNSMLHDLTFNSL